MSVDPEVLRNKLCTGLSLGDRQGLIYSCQHQQSKTRPGQADSLPAPLPAVLMMILHCMTKAKGDSHKIHTTFISVGKDTPPGWLLKSERVDIAADDPDRHAAFWSFFFSRGRRKFPQSIQFRNAPLNLIQLSKCQQVRMFLTASPCKQTCNIAIGFVGHSQNSRSEKPAVSH